MKYPALFVKAPEGGYTVTFRDIPEAITEGQTIEEAREMATDALLTAMDFYFEDGRAVPGPSALEAGEELVALPLSAWAKVQLLNLRIEKNARPADIARAMGVKPQEVTRILDLHHATKIDTLAAAFRAMGAELTISGVKMTNAKFIGGPLGGQSHQVKDLDAFSAIDPDTGETLRYRRHTYAAPNGAEASTSIYVLESLSPDEANKLILQSFPSRNRR